MQVASAAASSRSCRQSEGNAFQGVFDSREAFVGHVGIGTEIDVDVVGRSKDPVGTQADLAGEVATLVLKIEQEIELVGVPVAQNVAGSGTGL